MTRQNGKDEVSKNVINFLKTRFGSNLTKTDQEQLQNIILSAQPDVRTKDPNKPKRGNSAYIYFCEDKRPGVTKEYPNLEAKQIIAKLADLWKEAKDNPKEVKKYYDLAEADKERYHAEMKDYTPPAAVKRGKKNSSLPKKAKSAYLFFYEDKRPGIVEKNPGMKATDITRIIGAEWTKIKDSAPDIAKYVKLAEKDKERYVKELQGMKEGVEQEPSESVEAPREKPPVAEAGYSVFADKMTKTIKKRDPEASNEDIAKKLSCLWKDLDDEGRAKFAKQETKKSKK